jgi:hypothetical protein
MNSKCIFLCYFQNIKCLKSIEKDEGKEHKFLEAYVGPTSKFPDLKSTCLSTLVTCKWCQTCYKANQEVSRSNKQVKYFTSSIKTTSLKQIEILLLILPSKILCYGSLNLGNLTSKNTRNKAISPQ